MILQIRNLLKEYDGKPALRNVNLDLEGGNIVGLFGPNGSGKTTLIKILANLLMRYSGNVLIDGIEPGVETKKFVSYLPDVNYLDNNWKVKECINVFQKFYGDFDSEKAKRLLAQFQISLDSRIGTLSKGNREKTQLILVLSRNAKLFLFDEPIAGVDPASREIIFDLIRENIPVGSTVIITTHLIIDIEKIVDHVIFINQGDVFLNKPKDELEKEYDGKTINEIFIELFKQRMYGGM